MNFKISYCFECGKRIASYNSIQDYCSKACKQKAYRKRKKEAKNTRNTGEGDTKPSTTRNKNPLLGICVEYIDKCGGFSCGFVKHISDGKNPIATIVLEDIGKRLGIKEYNDEGRRLWWTRKDRVPLSKIKHVKVEGDWIPLSEFLSQHKEPMEAGICQGKAKLNA